MHAAIHGGALRRREVDFGRKRDGGWMAREGVAAVPYDLHEGGGYHARDGIGSRQRVLRWSWFV